MGIVLRSVKGEPLTVAEMDQNLRELDSRIKTLEDLAHAETAFSVESSCESIVFKNGLGFEVGRAVLPKWMPRVRGEWQPGEVYALGDWVRFEGKLYFCNAAHVAPFSLAEGEDVFDAKNWDLLLG